MCYPSRIFEEGSGKDCKFDEGKTVTFQRRVVCERETSKIPREMRKPPVLSVHQPIFIYFVQAKKNMWGIELPLEEC